VNESRTGGDAYLGFFNFAIGSTIKNVRLFGNIVGSNTGTGRNEGSLYVGGLAGYMDGTVENCSVSGTILGIGANLTANTGGIAGRSEGRITDCIVTKGSTVEVNGGGHIFSGGIAGKNEAAIVHCCNEASVSAENASSSNNSGGIAGKNATYSQNIGTIINCWNTGKVFVIAVCFENYAGGIVGRDATAIKNCYNTGEIFGNYKNNEKSGDVHPAGIVGIETGGIVENCYNVGKITVIPSENNSPAGIFGEIESFNDRNVISKGKNCYYLTGGENPTKLFSYHDGSNEISGCGTFIDAGGDLTLDGTETENNKLAAAKLIDALNAWVDAQNDLSLDGWRVAAGVNGGYPVLRERHTVTFEVNGGDSLTANTSVVVNGDAARPYAARVHL
jgi:hypothetical protein